MEKWILHWEKSILKVKKSILRWGKRILKVENAYLTVRRQAESRKTGTGRRFSVAILRPKFGKSVRSIFLVNTVFSKRIGSFFDGCHLEYH